MILLSLALAILAALWLLVAGMRHASAHGEAVGALHVGELQRRREQREAA